MSLLSCQNVNYEIQGNALLKEVSLEIASGECVGILGPSGCGKSTLLRMLAGLISPTKGLLKKNYRNCGYVFQDPQLLDWRSTIENVQLPLEIQKVDLKKAEQALQLVELSEAQHLFPHQLSGGMRMRVSLARALVISPDIVFFDEPLSALDEINRENLQNKLNNLRHLQKWSAVLVTHSMTEALRLCDRIFVFEQKAVLSKDYVTVDKSKFDDQLQLLKNRLQEPLS